MERKGSRHQPDYDSSVLYSGKGIDRILDELEKEARKTKNNRGIKIPEEEPAPPKRKRVASISVDQPDFQIQANGKPAMVEGMVYLYDPDGKRLMSFKAKLTPGLPNNTRRGSLIDLLTSQENSWRVTDRNSWKGFRQSGDYQQANSREVFNELLQRRDVNS